MLQRVSQKVSRKVLRKAAFTAVLAFSQITLAQSAPGANMVGANMQLTQAKRPFTFADLMKLKRVEEPVPTPDGKWVLFGAVDVDLDANTKIPHIWIVPLGGGESRQLTNGKEGEDRPRISPDGKTVAFTSAKDGSQQIWGVSFDSAIGTFAGEPRKLTSISTEADGEIWSPDGKNLMFVSRVYPDCAGSPSEADTCNKQRDEAASKSKVQAKIFTKLFYRHWNAYADGKRSHLFVVSAEGGTARDITPGDYDVPPFSLGGPDDYDISPDGKEVAYTSNHEPVEAISTNNDIWLVPIDCGEAGVPKCEAKKISTSPGSDDAPRYSPDGKWIAWRMQKRNGYESDKFNLVVYDRKSGEIKNLTENFDTWVESYVWTPDSKTIYLAADSAGEQPVYSLDLAKELIGGEPGNDVTVHLTHVNIASLTSGFNDDLTITPDGKELLFTRMGMQFPTGIFGATVTRLPVKGDFCGAGECPGAIKKLSDLNDHLLSQVQMPPMESFWFTGAKNEKVQGFMVKPPNFDARKKYPLKFIVHGGPQVPEGDEWSYRWNPELFAANGYVVIMINFHGSPGYGQKFVESISGDWGGAPFQDLMLGLDYAEKTYPFIDKDRECALGGSYGGYMTNWILGHTHRFKCLVTHDGDSDTEAGYGQTEELWFEEWEFKGLPWTDRENYRKWSPILFAQNFKTPTLVVHGQKDYRLDVSQGFELFTTLQRLGVPSKMLYFPDEGHWVLKPQNSQLWYKTVSDWVDQWIGK